MKLNEKAKNILTMPGIITAHRGMEVCRTFMKLQFLLFESQLSEDQNSYQHLWFLKLSQKSFASTLKLLEASEKYRFTLSQPI